MKYAQNNDEDFHKLLIEPVDGPTTHDETVTEWRLGQLFKVLCPFNLPIKRGALITEQELTTFLPHHNVEIEFNTLSQAEWHEAYGVTMGDKLEQLADKWGA